MAIKEIKREWSPCQLDYVKTFLLHSEKELKDLPKCCIGSKAIVSETDNEYYCTESGWKLGSELGGPSEVVILPETELFVTDDSTGDETTFYGLRNKYEVAPVVGGTYKLLFGGDEHTSKAVDMSAVMGEGAVAMGNTDLMGLSDAGIVAPDPTAQYVFCAFPNGSVDAAEGLTYGLLVASGLSEHPILSIVQTEGAASGGNAGGGGVFIVKPVNIEQGNMSDVLFSYDADLDKPFEEAVAAFQSGQQVVLEATNLMGMDETMQIPLVAVSDAVSYFTAFVGGVVIVGEYSEYLRIHGTSIV